MSEPAFTRKVYICSRQAAATSRSTSDFDLTLSRNLVLPQKCAGFITDIQIPHSWYAVDAGQRFLYYRMDALTTIFGRVELQKGNYTGEQLAEALRDKMAAESLPSGLSFFASYDPHLHIIRYALAPHVRFSGDLDRLPGRHLHFFLWQTAHRNGRSRPRWSRITI